MAPSEDLDAVRKLAVLAQVAVIRVRAGNPAPRTALQRARSWWWGALEGPDSLRAPESGMLWRDAWSQERVGWRERAAFFNGDELFGVDYETCRRCKLGWVEQPTTHHEKHRRCGLAAAALAALRHEHPGLQWHTLGGHLTDSVPFWEAVGREVPGGYSRRPLCLHTHPGG